MGGNLRKELFEPDETKLTGQLTGIPHFQIEIVILTLNHLTDFVTNPSCKVSKNRKKTHETLIPVFSHVNTVWRLKKIEVCPCSRLEVCSYLDCAEKLAAANMAASTSMLS